LVDTNFVELKSDDGEQLNNNNIHYGNVPTNTVPDDHAFVATCIMDLKLVRIAIINVLRTNVTLSDRFLYSACACLLIKRIHGDMAASNLFQSQINALPPNFDDVRNEFSHGSQSADNTYLTFNSKEWENLKNITETLLTIAYTIKDQLYIQWIR
jgi:hypothetical protein